MSLPPPTAKPPQPSSTADSNAGAPARDERNSAGIFQVKGFSANLPVGGGAIRGLQEKVEVDQFRGALRFSIPLPIQPVRNGVTPELGLAYDSTSGNGPFGCGWNIAAPAVARRVDRGVPTYNDGADEDRLMLAGGEIIRTLDEAGQPTLAYYSLDGRSLPGLIDDTHFEVRSYRARVETEFQRIEWWRKMSRLEVGEWVCLESFWRVLSKSNVTRIFGFSSSARLAAPGGTQIFQWQLERCFDDSGNAVLYEYAQDPGESSGKPFASPCYLVSAKYGNLQPCDRAKWLQSQFPIPGTATSPWMFELRFDYGDPIAEPAQSLRELVTAVENPAGKDRAVPPAQGPLRLDSFFSYRSGFAIRTRRLCRRVLGYHHIEGQYVGLARTLELVYEENVYLSKLIAVTQVAWDGAHGRAFPPLQLAYAEVPDLTQATLQALPQDALPTLRANPSLPAYAWVDLDAEGAPGALFQSAGGAWLYARNRGPAQFTAPEPVGYQGAVAGPFGAMATTPAIKLLDIGGDGLLDSVDFRRPNAGARARAGDYSWEGFTPFKESPAFDPDDPNVRFMDLDGDGLSDIIFSEQGAYVWQRSLGAAGFAPPERLPWGDGNDGPRLLFADRDETVYLADMTGDGLTDLVRIRNGEVCYWPNLGRGRFGRRMELQIRQEDGTPTGASIAFDRSQLFSQKRIKLLDIDGTGSTDLAYLGAHGLRCWRNQCGNGFSAPIDIPFPPVDDPAAVSVVDLMGDGTSCLLLAPGSAGFGTSAHYLHLVDKPQAADGGNPRLRSQKPHLLTRCSNNLGGETCFRFSTSAQFCVADRENGHPWITKTGFPVQVIESIEHRDLVTARVEINQYRYRHGYFDGVEREFNGFAYVEQCDSVVLPEFRTRAGAALAENGSHAEAFHLPPTITRTWFHTGAVLRGDALSRRLRSEYFHADPDARFLPDTVLPDLPGSEADEAVRSLRGQMLRQEIYSGADECGCIGPDARPYLVTEKSYAVRRLQPRGRHRHGAYRSEPAEEISYHYERQVDDPRIEHQFTLEVDAWGNPTQTARVAYGRREAGLRRDALFLDDEDREVQARSAVDYTLRWYTQEFADPISFPLDHHAPLLCEEITWEIRGLAPQDPRGYFVADQLRGLSTRPDLPKLPYASQDQAAKGRRRIEHLRQHYWAAGQGAAATLGTLALPALPHQAFRLAFTEEMRQHLGQETGELPTPSALNSAGYLRRRDLPSAHFPADSWPEDADADAWWAASPFLQHDPADFSVPVRQFDSFYSVTEQRFGIGSLLPERITDPLGNVTRVENDYRLLQPRQTRDLNDSVTALLFDVRGLVAALAVQGNQARPTGDNLSGIAADLSPAELASFLAAPAQAAQPGSGSIASIRKATSRFLYDVFAACDLGQPIGSDRAPCGALGKVNPPWAVTLHRQFHVNQDRPAAPSIEIAFAYSNGFAEIAQTKQLTSAARLDPVDSHAGVVDPRWIGSGWKIHNNKGSVVRQYQPFFTATHLFEFERREGDTATNLYDPLERLAAKVTPHRIYRPDGTPEPLAPVGHAYEKHLFHAWGDATWDANDTVLLHPLDDPDVGEIFDLLEEREFLPTWYQQRTDEELIRRSWPANERHQRWEREAAAKTAVHAATPTRTFLDPRGRTFLTVQHHRREPGGAESFFHTRTVYDIEGNQRAVIDARGRTVMQWEYSMVGLPWCLRSMDAGRRVLLTAVDGRTVMEWDAQQRRIVHTHDVLRRPRSVQMHENGATATRESYTYGESVSGGADRYLRGQLHQQVDDGGTLTIARYDWHGQPIERTRNTSLGGRTVSRSDVFDTQSRLVRSTCGPSRVERTYSVSGQLIALSAAPGGDVVTRIAYNPAGQRVLIQHGGAAPSVRFVPDPVTGRVHFQQAGDTQDLHHVFDPSGNPTHLYDANRLVEFFQNQRVEPLQRFAYDSLYRLISVEGREHCSHTSATWEEKTRAGSPFDLCVHPHEQHAFRNYTERYEYDAVHNLVRQRHIAGTGSWTREFKVAPRANHLVEVHSSGSVVETFAHDEHGNVTRMGHLSALEWDFRDRLVCATRAGSGERSRFGYDASGERVVKVEPRGTRTYFGEFEFYSSGAATHSIVLRDAGLLLAIVDHAGGGSAQVRSQLTNHLGSSTVEIDQTSGREVAREEYYPYGGASYVVTTSGAPARRYRFTAKERDESTGLNYHGARYYAPWLSRWISPDPSGVKDSANRYLYALANPVRFVDVNGRASSERWEDAKTFLWSAAKGAAIAAAAVVVVAAVVVAAPVVVSAAAGLGATVLGASGATAAAVSSAAYFGTAVVTEAAVANLALFGTIKTAQTVSEIYTGVDENGRKLTRRERIEISGELVGGFGGGFAAARGLQVGLQKFGRTVKPMEPEPPLSPPSGEPPKAPLALPAPDSISGSSLSDVSKSLFKTGRLPENFITKQQAEALGWDAMAGNLGEVAPGKSIGGNIFRNRQGLLPNAPGRVWFEADLNYRGGYRGAERLVYSNDRLIFYTGDHYKTFQMIGAAK